MNSIAKFFLVILVCSAFCLAGIGTSAASTGNGGNAQVEEAQAGPLAKAGVVYATTGHKDGGNFLTIDPATGAGTLVGPTGLSAVPGLAINSKGEIYGAEASNGKLYKIDASTGAATFVANTGLSFLDAIAFDADDNLYGVDAIFNLYRIDPATGATTVVGNTGENITGLAFNPVNGSLWGSSGGVNSVVKDGIYKIDKTNGNATLIGKTGLGGATPDIFFDENGNLFGVKGGGGGATSTLISIDKSTGAGTVIGSVGFKSVSGLAYGLIPDISGTPSSHDFGSVEVGASGSHTFKIRNVGNTDLHVTSTNTAGSDAGDFSVTSGGGAFTLAPGASHNVTVKFEPNSPGAKSANLRIRSDDPDEDPFNIALTGVGTSPEITVNPSTYDFGSILVQTGVEHVFDVRNDGSSDLVVTSVSLTGLDADQFAIINGSSSFIVAPGTKRTIRVRFQPTSAGTKSAALRLNNNDLDENPFDVILSGTGLAPDISVSPTAYNFGDITVGTDSPQTLLITNNGNADLVIDSITLIGPQATEFSVNLGTPPLTLPPGTSQTVTVDFNPVDAGLTQPSTLAADRVTDGQQLLYAFDEGGGQTVDDVSGTGLPMHLIIADTGAVSWLDNGLAVNDTTLIASFFPAAEETEALKLTNAITIEAWVKPLDALQGGPARMVTLSGDPSNRNFTLGQAGDAYDVRLRTTLTDLNGTPSVASPAGTASPNLMHVVYTRDASGQVKLYIDSVEQTSSAVGGDFSNWDSAYRFALANEFSLDRPWLGEFHLVAIYDRALSPAEIGQNFLAGPTGTGSTPGRKSASLLISSNDPDQGQMYLSLTGNAVPNPVPDIAVNPTAVDFGATLLNSTASQSVVIHNEGTVDLQINSIALGGANAGEFSVDNSGPATIAAGESLTVSINFTPTSEGAKSASLAISSNDPDEAALNVALQGSGGLPDISVTPTAYSYGTVTIGQTATHGFTITNAGTFDLEVATISLLGTNASEFSVSIGGEFVLAPGQSQAVDVNFSPGSEGAKTATLRIESNDPDENPLDVVVSGNAVTTPIPDIAVNPTSHDFGDVQVDQASNQMVEVSNVGAADLNVTSIAITGADSTDFSVADTTPFTLAAGASKTVEVSFTPHTVGAKSAALRLESNDPDENPLAVDLTGNATTTSAANIAATPTSYDFGVLNVGETATHSFFISNDGASDLQVTGVSITGTNADQFAVVSGGGAFTLTPGQNREIQVLFNPTTFSAKSAILRIESNDANDNPLDIQLSGYLNTPPPMPLLVYPAYEDTADVLKWSRSNDPDNGDQITYTIEILSNQPTFRAETQDTSMTIDEIAQSFNLIDGTFYFWRVKASDNHGAASDFSPLGKFLYVANTVTGVKDDRSTNPTSFRLAQNFPNPFNPTTQIDYELPARANVTLAIYDIRGRLVRRLLDGEDKPSGTHSVFWDGKDASGNSVSSGVYFYAIRISAAETGKTFVQTKKMTLLK